MNDDPVPEQLKTCSWSGTRVTRNFCRLMGPCIILVFVCLLGMAEAAPVHLPEGQPVHPTGTTRTRFPSPQEKPSSALVPDKQAVSTRPSVNDLPNDNVLEEWLLSRKRKNSLAGESSVRKMPSVADSLNADTTSFVSDAWSADTLVHSEDTESKSVQVSKPTPLKRASLLTDALQRQSISMDRQSSMESASSVQTTLYSDSDIIEPVLDLVSDTIVPSAQKMGLSDSSPQRPCPGAPRQRTHNFDPYYYGHPMVQLDSPLMTSAEYFASQDYGDVNWSIFDEPVPPPHQDRPTTNSHSVFPISPPHGSASPEDPPVVTDDPVLFQSVQPALLNAHTLTPQPDFGSGLAQLLALPSNQGLGSIAFPPLFMDTKQSDDSPPATFTPVSNLAARPRRSTLSSALSVDIPTTQPTPSQPLVFLDPDGIYPALSPLYSPSSSSPPLDKGLAKS